MRGMISGQAMLCSYLSPEARVPATHPLRPLKAMTDEVVQKLSPTCEAMYSQTGRPLDSAGTLAERRIIDRAVLRSGPSDLLRDGGLPHPVPLVSGHEP